MKISKILQNAGFVKKHIKFEVKVKDHYHFSGKFKDLGIKNII